MFKLFGRKKKEEEGADAPVEEGGDEGEEAKAEAPPPTDATNVAQLLPEIDRLKAGVAGFTEVRKAMTERMASLNEQIGELRAMILDRDRSIQEIELKAVKAADLVDSVHPDKLMIELQKEDAKFEALKANLEGNESIMDRVMEELKEMRQKLDFFRGVDEIVKLAEETRKELVEIKKVEANIHIDTDKVETIYGELRKKFQEIDLFSDSIKEIKVTMEQNTKDVETMKTKVSSLATKDELDRLVNKVQRYIDALQELNKSSSLTRDVAQLKSILEGLK